MMMSINLWDRANDELKSIIAEKATNIPNTMNGIRVELETKTSWLDLKYSTVMFLAELSYPAQYDPSHIASFFNDYSSSIVETE